jgi:hypothetical protein
MAKKRTKPRRLTLKLDGKGIPAERFLKSVSSFVNLINEVSDNASGTDNAFCWVVSVESGSSIVHFAPEPKSAAPAQIDMAMDAIEHGFAIIENRAERPQFWSDLALKRAKELSEALDVVHESLNKISVASGSKASVVTRKTSHHVDQLIGSDKSALGTIEGKLRTVTEGGGLHFVVHDALTQNRVRCYFDDSKTDEIIAAFRQRVAVYGQIRYRMDGVPVSIRVHDFRVLRDHSKLPGIQDVRGILSN